MFGKLIKHEWRATAPTQGLLALAALGISILAGFVLRMLTNYGEEMPMLLDVGIGISLGFMALGFVACFAAMWFLLLVRFYKNKFTDEGYLTFTLPVNSHQIFLSSFVNMLIWSVIGFLMVILGVGIFLIIGLADLSQVDMSQLLQEFQWVTQELPAVPELAVTYTVQTVLAVPYSIIITMTCITAGAVIAKKHKILAAFGIYYGISYVTGIITSIAMVLFSMRNLDHLLSSTADMPIYDSTIQSMLVTITLEVILMVGGYILSTQLMKRKLNLP